MGPPWLFIAASIEPAIARNPFFLYYLTLLKLPEGSFNQAKDKHPPALSAPKPQALA